MKLSDNIKYFMNLKGMKPADLARKSNVSQPRIHEIVNDITKNPQMKTLNKIAEALGISTDALICENPEGYAGDPRRMLSSDLPTEIKTEEAEALRILREYPEVLSVVKMMGEMDRDTQKDIQRHTEKEKQLQDLIKERQGKDVA